MSNFSIIILSSYCLFSNIITNKKSSLFSIQLLNTLYRYVKIVLQRFKYRGSPTSTVSTSTISTSTNFIAIGIKLVLVGDQCNCYVVKLVLVEIGYVVLTSTNFAQYDFFKIPKFVLSEDPLYHGPRRPPLGLRAKFGLVSDPGGLANDVSKAKNLVQIFSGENACFSQSRPVKQARNLWFLFPLALVLSLSSRQTF